VSGHIDDLAGGLAASPESDPDRVAAYEHARTCRRCADALAQAEQLLTLLRTMPRPAGPSEEALERAFRAVTGEMTSANEPEKNRSNPVAAKWPFLGAALAALAVSLLISKLEARGPALAWKIGVECLLIELVTATAALVFVGRALRRRHSMAVPHVFTAVAAWGALTAQLYLQFRCPMSHEGPHVLLFHFGGVLLATALGGVVARLNTPRHGV
jgi:hypothetical protein